MAAPTILLASYDPGKLYVQWLLPGAPPPGLTGYRLAVEGSGGYTLSQDTGITPTFLTLAADLSDATQSYALTVATLIDGAPGEASPPLTLITTPLSLLSLVYDLAPDTLGGNWMPPKAPAEGGLLSLTGAGTVRNATGTTTAAIDASLTGDGSAYTATLRPIAQGGIVQGPSSPAYAPIAQPLSLLSLVYDLAPDTLSGNWMPPKAPAEGGLLSLTGAGTVRNATGTTTAAIDASLTGDGSAYTATLRPIAQGGIVQGPSSPAYTPIAQPLSLLSLVYDLAPDTLSGNWMPPKAPAEGGLLSLTGAGTVRNATGTTTAAIDASLTGDGSAYTATLRPIAQGGIVQGPSSPAYTPIAQPLVLTSVAYAVTPAAQLGVAWAEPPPPATQGLATLTGGASVITRIGALSVTFDGALTGDGTAYKVAGRAVSNGGIVQGPVSARYTPITTALSMMTLIYDTGPDRLSVQWAQPGAPAAGGIARLEGPSLQQTAMGATAAGFDVTLAPGLPPGQGYSLAICASDASAVVNGPRSAFAPIAEPIALRAITYDTTPDTVLSLAWDALSATAEEGLATLSDASGVQNLTGAAGVAFAGAVDGTARVTARQIASLGRIQGPATQAYAPITTTTTMTGAAYDLTPAVLTADWAPASGTDIAYLAELTTDGTPAAAQPTAGASAAFAGALPADKTSTVAVRVTDATGLLRGPQSAPVTVLTTRAATPRLAYLTSAAFRATWAQESGAEGALYRFNVDDVPGTPVAATGTTALIEQAIAPGKIYGLQLRLTAGLAQGPWSLAAPGPYLLDATAEHDALGRLTSFEATGFGRFTYARDAAGNLLRLRFAAADPGAAS